METFATCDFFADICKSKNDNICHYALSHTAAQKSCAKVGHVAHEGHRNRAMNSLIQSYCKKEPLCYFAFSKQHLIDSGCGDLIQLKLRTISHIAKNIIK